MALDPDEIIRLVGQALPDASIHIEDMRGDGTYYVAHVASTAFHGKNLVDQHRMVYRALQDKIVGDGMQSLSLRTTVPEAVF